MPVLMLYYDITVNQLAVLCLADRRTGMKFMMRFGTLDFMLLHCYASDFLYYYFASYVRSTISY